MIARNRYRSFCRKRRATKLREFGNTLPAMASSAPGRFWQIFHPGTRSGQTPIHLSVWHEYFSNMFDSPGVVETLPVLPSDDLYCLSQVVDETDPLLCEITCSEVQCALNRIGNRKAVGWDGYPIEVFKGACSFFLPILKCLFNCFLKNALVPNRLKYNLLSPVFKKGESHDPNNYRAISVTSNLFKVYSSILTERFTTRLETIRVPTQGGFRPQFSTVDNLFLLATSIDQSFLLKRPLFLSFLDIAKAYDSVDHSLLEHRMKLAQVPAAFCQVLQSLTKGHKTMVVTSDGLSEPFEINRGVLQGDPFSPIKFSLFFEPLYFHLLLDVPNLSTSFPFVLFYADDTAYLSYSVSQLQNLLDSVLKFCGVYGLKLSVPKCLSMVFTRSPQVSSQSCLQIEGTQVPSATIAPYLGVLFDRRRTFIPHMRRTVADCKQQIALIHSRCGALAITDPRTRYNLFRSLVLSKLLYGSQIWYVYLSPTRRNELELLHTEFLSTCLRAHPKSPTCLLYSELNTKPLSFYFCRALIKYWNKLVQIDDSSDLRYQTFRSEFNSHGADSWVTRTVVLLSSYFPNRLELQYPVLYDYDVFLENYLSQLNAMRVTSPSRIVQFYNTFATVGRIPTYLQIANEDLRVLMTRFRLGFYAMSHGNSSASRQCTLCHSGHDTEEHLLLNCPVLSSLRMQIFGPSATRGLLASDLFRAPTYHKTARFLKKVFQAKYQQEIPQHPILQSLVPSASHAIDPSSMTISDYI